MIKSTVIISMEVAGIVCFLFPIVVFLYFKKREKISFIPVLTGMIVFFVFTQILEKLLHMVVIGKNLIPNPILFSIYGGLAAGVFEETGRFIAFKTVLKDRHEWKDGLAYGIGHGGMEAILIGGVMHIQYMIYCNLINKGLFDTVIISKVPASQISQLNQIKQLLLNTTASTSIMSVSERIFAFGIQIALTMVVFYAVRYRKNIYLFIAILLHALLDTPAVLYQMKIITSIFAVECILAIYFIIAIIFLSKTKKIFNTQLKVKN